MEKKKCLFYSSRQGCRNEANCPYVHEIIPLSQKPPCKYYRGPGTCFHGDNCVYGHVEPATAMQSIEHDEHDVVQDFDFGENLVTRSKISDSRSTDIPCIREEMKCGECGEILNIEIRNEDGENEKIDTFEKHYRKNILNMEKKHTEFLSRDQRFDKRTSCRACGREYKNSLDLLKHVSWSAKSKSEQKRMHADYLEDIIFALWGRDLHFIKEEDCVNKLVQQLTFPREERKHTCIYSRGVPHVPDTSCEEEFPPLARDVTTAKKDNSSVKVVEPWYESISQEKASEMVNMHGVEMLIPKQSEIFMGESEELLELLVKSYMSKYLPGKKFEYIARELYVTEKNYGQNLLLIAEYFKVKIPSEFETQLKEHLSRLHSVYEFHSKFINNTDWQLDIWKTQNRDQSCTIVFKRLLHTLYDSEIFQIYQEYKENCGDFLKTMTDLKQNPNFFAGYEEFEEQRYCRLSIEALITKPVERLDYYIDLISRTKSLIEKDVVASDCFAKLLSKLKAWEGYGSKIEGTCIPGSNQPEYTELRWKGMQLKHLSDESFQEAERATKEKRSNSDPIQYSEKGRQLRKATKSANNWAAEQMLLKRCKLMATGLLDLHYLFRDEAKDVLGKLLPAIEEGLHSLPVVPFELDIDTGKGIHTENGNRELPQSVEESLRYLKYRYAYNTGSFAIRLRPHLT